MEITKAILPETLSSGLPAIDLQKINNADDEKKMAFAKDFESVFLDRLFGEMRKTIGKWGLEEDSTSEQIQGIFWLYLARDLAEKGGFGLSKDIYQSLTDSDQQATSAESLDKSA